MPEELKIVYELPILDICGCIIALLAFLIAVYALYLSNQTRVNTEDTVAELKHSSEELVKIRILISSLNLKQE
jgi:hypothetical protein